MLTARNNELITQTGPGTPMGDYLRRYWVPALTARELPQPDCPPLRLTLLGERLVAFRATSGEVGLVQENCPHRGASLFFGRNEEDGLRCVYHGWKFDTGAPASTCRLSPQRATSRPRCARRHTRRSSAAASSGPTWARRS